MKNVLHRFKCFIAAVSAVILATIQAPAHNLDTTTTSILFARDFIETMTQRAAVQVPLIQPNDEFWVLLQTTPGPGTQTGVGGYQTFYVPDGVRILDTAYVFPDASDPRGFRNIPMKGQSPMAIGNGSIAPASTPEFIGWELPGVNGLGVKFAPVTATGVDRGTLAGVYADTGIFYSTDLRTKFNSYGMPAPPLIGPPAPMKNNSGDTVGEYYAANVTNSITRNVFGVMTLWDSYQLRAYGRADVSPLIDDNGRGNAPWGLANVVAGPQSGYAWEFDFNAYENTAGTSSAKLRAAIKIGPWNRIQYPGSQIAADQAGLISNVLGHVGIDASLMGVEPSAIPGEATAVRFAIGQLELGRPEYSAVKVKINTAEAIAECFEMFADAFGGDAGGTEGGKDHMWRYFDPTVVTLNPCVLLQKVASKALVAPGETFYYDIVFANNGTITLPNMTLTDTLPSGLVHVSATPVPTTIASPNFTWNIGTVGPGQLVKIRQYVKATGSGTLFNTVSAKSDGNPVGVAQASVEVGARAILEKRKSVTPSAVAPGATVTYTLEIDNVGTGLNGTPLRVREFLPAGFTFVSLQGATLNGAAIASPTIAVDSSNVSQPLFTIGQGIQPGKKLIINFAALVGASIQPGTYFNSFQLEYEGKVVAPTPEAPVIVAGGKIGDTVWYDWNGNGTQDPGEAGIPGATVELFEGDGTTLVATTTTDANGKYYFPGLADGDYVVKVTPPAGTTQSGDPDSTLDHQHPVSLATDEQYLTADFGYQPTGAGSLGDRVFEDVGNDGGFDAGTDTGISGVAVQLYADTNGDGVVTPGVDVLIGSTTTDGSGNYSFTGLAEGFDYIAVVAPADSALATYFAADPYQASTANPQPVTDLAGSYLNADFGFWRIDPSSIGDQVFIDADGNGLYNPAIDSPLGGVTVTLLRNGSPVATTTTAPDGSYLFDNLGPGNYTVVVDVAGAGVPAGYAPSVGQHAVNLAAGQDFLTADFPFAPLIAKSVDKEFAEEGDTLNFGVNVNYTGDALLSGTTVRDFLPVGTSFAAAQQGGQLVTFTSAPGIPGQSTFGGDPIRRVYAFQGGSTAFWGYNPATNAWDSTTLPAVPGTTTTGSALTSNGSRYLYAFQGGSRAFYRYDAVLKTWSDAAVADLPGTAAVQGVGASLVYLDGFIYAFPGNTTNQFWRYGVAANTWTPLNSAPDTVLVGAGLATDGTDIYALRGGGNNFWRYDMATGTWAAALANIGQSVGAGSGFVHAVDGLFYATTGGGQSRIYSYAPDANTWTQGFSAVSPSTGGDLAYDGTSFYVTQGNNTNTFVRRSYSVADVALAPTPGAVNTGGGLTFLQSPAGVLDSALSVSPSIVAVGSPVTVTLTVQATSALTNLLPSALTLSGVSATVSGPSPASLDLAANTPATFTWTVTPTSSGVLTFAVSASGSGGAVFAAATSNSLLASPDGGNQFVEWQLGGNVPGQPGSTSAANYLYGLRGNNSSAFWAYQVPQTAPGTWNSPLDPTDLTGFLVNAGGALAGDRNRYIYALQGGGLRTFLRYDTVSGSWSDAAVADLPAQAAVINTGGAMVFLNGHVYAWPGGGSDQFWRFNVASGAWEQRSNTLATVLGGAGLTTDGTFIYGTRGGATQTFWRYTPGTNTWEAMTDIGRNSEPGSAIRYANGFIYALAGRDRRFYRYDVAANTWTRLTDSPANFKLGAALVTDGTDLYAFRGDIQTSFYRYNVATSNWTTLAAAPGTVAGGGALAFQPTGNVSQTVATASRSMVGGIAQVLVRMTITSDNTLNNITANVPTFTATGGATATFGSATLISPDDDISGTGDPVIYEWLATVTPGASIGAITFTTTSSLGGSAGTRSVIVTPTLTYSALVGANPPPVINNTALVNETGGAISNVPSNTTRTATAASIGDFVWADLDADGIQDAGEYGLAGVTVRLYAADGVTLIATEVTDASGAYRFFGLAAGDHVVAYDVATAPTGHFATTPLTVAVTLTSGEQFDAADFGLTQPPAGTGSIGDFVWIDTNNDGVQDEGEPGIAGVNAILERLINGQWVQVATTTTDANGAYLFSGLSAADYRVTIDLQSQITSPYAQGTFALGDVMAPTYDGDGISTPHAALVTLATDSTVIDSTDFGYNWSGSIGDFVWWDYNTDGLQNESPLVGIEGARVQLYFDHDFDGDFDRILGDYEVLRVFTAADGSYLIGNLPPGNYFVDVYEDSLVQDSGIRNVVLTTDDIIPANLLPGDMNIDTADFGYFEGARVEATLFWDVNHNAILEAGEQPLENITATLTGSDTFGNPVSATALSDANGHVVFLVPEGDYTISYATGDITTNYPALGTPTTPLSFVLTAVAGDDGIRLFNFGVDNTGAIGDTIFADIDGDGSRSGSEPGLEGVTVNLYYDANGDGTIDFEAGDLLLETILTDANGNYLFVGLDDTVGSARYTVEVLTATLPAGYLAEASGFPAGADEITSRYSTALVNGETIGLVDFGYPLVPDVYHSVSGTIYHDNGDGVGGTSSDGTLNGDEPGLEGVSVSIEVDGDGNGSYDQTYMVFTDANGGFYSLGGIPDGANVRVTVNESTLPGNAFVQTGDPDGAVLSNVWTITNVQAAANDLDFGYLEALGSIAGTIVHGNGNGIADSGEPLIGGVSVTLTWFGPDGIPGTADDETYTTTADANGGYEFTGLYPGGYEVTTGIPGGYHAYADADGINPNSINVTLALGEDVTARDFEYQSGSLNGTLWSDPDADGTREAGEPLLENVTVFLDLDGDGQLDPGEAFTTTDANGFYEFEDLDAGSHQVRVDPATLPGGLLPSFDVDGVSSAHAAVVTLAPNQNLSGVDFGYYQSGSLAGTVLVDTTGNGLGDTPLGGVTLALLDENGDPVLDGNNQPVTALTDGNGEYVFAGLRPGSYMIAQIQPSGYGSTSDKDGGNFNLIGDVALAVVSAGQTNPANDFVEFLQKCPDTWAAWQALWPLGGANGPTANPDGDRYNNLLEYAFCLAPNSGAGEAFCLEPSLVVLGGVAGTFHRTAGGPLDLTYVLEYSATPGTPTVWQSLPLNSGNTTVTRNGDGSETVTIPDLEALTGLTAGTGFVRIRADLATGPVSAATEAHGWTETDLEICCRTYNNPYLRCASFTGTVDATGGVSGQMLNFTGSASGVDLAGLLAPGAAYYLEVTAGDNEGQRFDVASASGSSVTLANDSDVCAEAAPFNTFEGALPASLAGDSVVIRQHWTLGGLFPASGFFAAGTHTDADQVQTHAGGVWSTYWLYGNGGSPKWVKVGDGTMADQAAAVIPPGQGMFVVKRAPAVAILAYGEVRENDFIRPLCAGSNLVGGGYPVGQSANGTWGREMNLAAGFYGSLSFKAADAFHIWKGDATIGANGYDSYYFLNRPAALLRPEQIWWVKVGDATLASRDAAPVFLNDRSVFIRVASDLQTYTIPRPWSP